MSQLQDPTQNLHQYPSFEVPKLPELEFSFGHAHTNHSMAICTRIHEVDAGCKRSRADVSQDEQNDMIKKVRTLDERLAQLHIPTADTGKKIDVDVLQDVEEQTLLNARAIVRFGDVLKKAVKDIQELKSKVEDLEAEAIDAQQDLDSAHHKIKVHERLINQLAGDAKVDFLREYEYPSDDEEYSDDPAEQNVRPQTDSSV